MSKSIGNKKAKMLIASANLRTNELGEVSWITRVSINASGSSVVHSEYLGELDCLIMLSNVEDKMKKLGLQS